MTSSKVIHFFNSFNKPQLLRQTVRQFPYLIVLLFVLFVSCNSNPFNSKSSNTLGKTSDSLTTDLWLTDTIYHDGIIRLNRISKGDFDVMKQRRIIRALVVFSTTNFFFDNKGRPQGVSYETLTAFEKFINRNIKKYEEKIHIIQIPVRRDQLIPYLMNGNADLAVANLTITEERKEKIDFSNPWITDVKEIVVTGPNAPPIDKLKDLSGEDVWVRASSSYYNSLIALNKKFKQQGISEINIQKAEEQLETEDLLEMVAAGVINITISDDYIAKAWADVLNSLKLHSNLAINKNGQIAWMFRKNSPLLKDEINAFVAKNKKGTLLFNMKYKQYYSNNNWLQKASSNRGFAISNKMNELFKKYATLYNFDWMMITALAYQESHLNQNTISPAGAIGVMQILPSTARDRNVNIPNIQILENNIHAGTKYLRFILDNYYSDVPMSELNKHLFAFASYNAGPAKINRFRKQAEQEGFDPNVWFQNVEIIAGRNIGRETVQYVSNIFKYYLTYKLAFESDQQSNFPIEIE